MSRRKLTSGRCKINRRNWLLNGLIMLLLTGSSLSAVAQPWMSFQGVLQSSDRLNIGVNVVTNVTAHFSLYADLSDGEPVWSEEHHMAIDDGRYSVFLGSGRPLLPSQPPLYEALIDGHSYLGLAIEVNGTKTEILPRQQVASMPYALHSLKSQRLVNSQGEPLTQAIGNTVNVAGDARVLGSLQVSSLQSSGSGLTDLSASHFSSGTVPVSLIPSLPASKITSGSFSGTSVSASAFSGNPFPIFRIPNLPASKFSSGSLASANVPNLSAASISGRLSRSRIPSLPANKFTSGTLPINRGGTGYNNLAPGGVLITDGAGRLSTAFWLTYHTGARQYLRVGASANANFVWSDWDSRAIGGIKTWDVVAASVSARTRSSRSDARLKTNVVSLAELDLAQHVFDLRPVTFEWLENGDRRHFGFIAQEVQQLLPDLVDVGGDEMGSLSIRTDELLALLVRAMQEQQDVIDAQQAEWQALTAELDELEAELVELFEGIEQRASEGGAL